ncbi:MAG: hypothetical protein DMG32_26160 [Acidobacteria bacterium]|nr:MAG: hypothetical protein DMG32_26160 [Acidobacteriota bacterium]
MVLLDINMPVMNGIEAGCVSFRQLHDRHLNPVRWSGPSVQYHYWT